MLDTGPETDNYATSANGCRVAACSPSSFPKAGNSTPSPDVQFHKSQTLWVPSGSAAQFIVLDLAHLRRRPECYSVFGIESEAAGPTNPKIL